MFKKMDPETVSQRLLMQMEEYEFLPTQNKLCFPILQRLYLKMLIGVQFPPILIKGNQIINGHHRFIASQLAGIKLDSIPWEASKGTSIFRWDEITIDQIDWDTTEAIRAYHLEDSKSYNLSGILFDYFPSNNP